MNTPHRPMPQRVLPGEAPWALFDVAASRAIEAEALASHAPHELMQRAGTAVARLALAVAPHARRVWVACGPGNNGGDGLVAAAQLHRAGKAVQISLVGDAERLPADARLALADALQAGMRVSAELPDTVADLSIDALLGLGASRAPQGAIAAAIDRLLQMPSTVIAVDLPSGLNADTGQKLGALAARANHTVSLLTLKPGLFTADGRDHAGQIWLDDLGVAASALPPSARLAGADDLRVALAPRRHASHKGSFGDLAVVGGAPGMTGAALLAARAALAAGAGRVFLSLLDADGAGHDMQQPELMFRPAWWRSDPAVLARTTVVCGCGGGSAVREALPTLLARSARLVLDADALNQLAADPALQRQLHARAGRGQATVLTPHPLEGARLLDTDVATVQADRLLAARSLSRRHACVVLLKGSGTIVASPDGQTCINPTGNALLATGGTGDVLAGWVGGLWAQLVPAGTTLQAARQAALAATWLHGHAADRWLAQAPASLALRAGELSERMRETAAAREIRPQA
jgi:ADP-dependent NAD(P)H-hydrate dehydratase / NAD(P)H-hydrate epimerase